MIYGVYNLQNHQVCMPVDPQAPPSEENVRLAYAPTNPREFSTLALQMAHILKPQGAAPEKPVSGNGRAEVLADAGANLDT